MLSWGTQFIDAELDGRPDLVVVSGHVDDFSDENIPFRMRPQFYSNRGESFVEVEAETLGPYFQHLQLARGMSRLDWDQDGREDVAIVRLFEPAVLLANRTEMTGNSLVFDSSVHSTRCGWDRDRDRRWRFDSQEADDSRGWLCSIQ